MSPDMERAVPGGAYGLSDVLRARMRFLKLKPYAQAQGMQPYHFYAFIKPGAYPHVALNAKHLRAIAKLLSASMQRVRSDFVARGGCVKKEPAARKHVSVIAIGERR